MGQSVESFVGAYFAKLDGLIGGLTKKTYWTLWVGAIAIVLSLAAHAPDPLAVPRCRQGLDG